MEAYIPWLMVLIAVIALAAFVIHGRWFDRHPWPGSTRQELEDQMRRTHTERERREREEQMKKPR
jgi:FtsZ-interacting cell division protein ZipA